MASESRFIRCPRQPIRPQPRSWDAIDVLYKNIIPYDFHFFELLNDFIQREPWLERDKVMIDHLKSIGIEKGKSFKPHPPDMHSKRPHARSQLVLSVPTVVLSLLEVIQSRGSTCRTT
jgi:hypothetical protein